MPPDRLSPEFLQSVSFPSARIGKRGVDETHVRGFCEWVGRELVRLLNERVALEQEVSRLREQVREAGAQDPEDARTEALSIMLRAKQIADQYLANAQEYSRDIAKDARRQRDEILAEAKLRVGVMLDEAGTPARGDDLVRHDEVARRDELATELARLRASSQVCRTNLRAQMESLTHSIDEWEHIEDNA
jgi:cell division septum initiation protein DivIVA